MNKWDWLRVVCIAGFALSLVAAFLLYFFDFDLLRGYGTFWVGTSAVMTMYFVLGYSWLSVGWKQSEEGAMILSLTALLGALASVGFVVRVFIIPPVIPTIANVVVTIVFAWVMAWWSVLFTRRQVEARRAKRRVSR